MPVQSIIRKTAIMQDKLLQANQAYVDLAGRIDESTQEAWDLLAQNAEAGRSASLGESMQVYDVKRPKGMILASYERSAIKSIARAFNGRGAAYDD
jgi:hypothetical protein